MEAPETTLAAKNGLRLGYGLCNYSSVEGGVVTHGHDGGIDGFISSYRYMPEQNWGYVILLNSDNSQQALEGLITWPLIFFQGFCQTSAACDGPVSESVEGIRGLLRATRAAEPIVCFRG